MLPPAIAKLTAAFSIGSLTSGFLLGIVLQQSHTYFVRFKDDPKSFKCLVSFFVILNVVHMAICQVTSSYMSFGDYDKTPGWVISPWLPPFYILTCSISACITQLFHAHRLFILSCGSRLTLILVALGSLFQLTGSIVMCYCTTKTYDASLRLSQIGASCWLGGAAMTDLLIMTTMIWLHSQQQDTSVPRKSIALTIGNNSLTAAFCLIDLLLLLLASEYSHISANLCLIRLYSSSLLCLLNSRPKRTVDTDVRKAAFLSDLLDAARAASEERDLESQEESENDSPLADIRGILVVTTASLSLRTGQAETTNSQVLTRPSPVLDDFSGNNCSTWRADNQNGFTVDIVGGIR